MASWPLIGMMSQKNEKETCRSCRHHFGRSNAEHNSVLARLRVAKPEMFHLDGNQIGVLIARIGSRSSLEMQLSLSSEDGRCCLCSMTQPIDLLTVDCNLNVGQLNKRNWLG